MVRLSEALPRDWRVYEASDADATQDVDEMEASDLAACRRHCENYGLGGFVVHEGRAYFRWDAAEGLEVRRKAAVGCELHLGFAWQVRQPMAAALLDAEGLPATVGESLGRWLGPSDLILATSEGNSAGVAVSANLGLHGFPRGWPQIFTESSVLKNLLKKSGPCGAKRVSQVPASPAPKGVSLRPLQSFENARAVREATGMEVVKGWAVYDLLSWELGSTYVAEAYWWNMDGKGQWQDFTPHPENSPEMLLVEAGEPAERPEVVLELQHMVLAEGLLCLRFPSMALAASLEMGTQGALALALHHAQAGAALCRGMVRAGACSALVEHLHVQGNRTDAVRLLAALSPYLKGVAEEVWAPLLSMDLVSGLVRMLTEKPEVAMPAAVALSNLCLAFAEGKQLALAAGAGQGFADFCGRCDLPHGEVLALWHEADQQRAQQSLRAKRPAGDSTDWQGLYDLCCGELQEQHRDSSPLERRGKSWARTLAFAQVALGVQGTQEVHMRRGSAEQPFVAWVLGAEDMVEAYLAEEGFFQEANFVDRAPTEVVIVGEGLRELAPSRIPHREGYLPNVRTASCAALRWLLRLGAPLPDMLAVLTPEAHAEGVELPEEVLALVPNVPAVISTRMLPSESVELNLRCRTQGHLLFKQAVKAVKCPFASSAGAYADNAYILAVPGQYLEKALTTLAQEPKRLEAAPAGRGRLPCIFWGILDIKYDVSRPLLERVKVLETGDGGTSKFSNHGAKVKERYNEGYVKVEGGVDLHMYRVVSNDKKWTHDRMAAVGYDHIVPLQACYHREYSPDLALQIQKDLNVLEDDMVVLKLCNRSRAAGVVVTPVDELDLVLEGLLCPPKDLESWFEEGLELMKHCASDLGMVYQSFEEQQRHWWSNECPVFVAERFCRSTPVQVDDGKAVDATLRVGFALRAPTGNSQELQVDWLGGYWKLSRSEGTLREKIVSAARNAGTMDVGDAVLRDVYTALGDSVQFLFSEPEPSAAELREKYSEQPDLAAYFIARLGTSHVKARNMDLQKAGSFLKEAATRYEEGKSPCAGTLVGKYVQSYMLRAQGVLDAVGKDYAPGLFQQALVHFPTNANAYFYLGVAALQREDYGEAAENLSCSLLLDPDYKAPYVDLGVAFLNEGKYKEAVLISKAGEKRHPETWQFDYHIGIALYFMALQLRKAFGETTEFKKMAGKALASLQKAREGSPDKRRPKQQEPPWLPMDGKMLANLESEEGPLDLEERPKQLGSLFISFRNM